MVSDADAAAVLERNTALVGRNTLDGGWNNPDRANQNRTGIPNFFTLNRNGVLSGTLETFDILGPRTGNRTDAYLARFTELIGLGDADGSDVTNRSWKTTGDTFSGTGETAATLSALDYDDVYALAPTENLAEEQTVTVAGDNPLTVMVSLIEVVNGTAKTLATARGTLSDGVSATGFISSTGGAYYVRVETPRADAETVSGAASTVVSYTLSGSRSEIENPFQNDWITATVTTVLPMYGDGALEGTLSLSMKKSKAVTAKYSNGKTTLATFTGKWDATTVEADGTASLTLTSKKGGYTLTLVMDAQGVVSAEVADGTAAVASGDVGLGNDFTPFAGYYTAALMPDGEDDGGCGYMTLTMTSASAKRNGKFSYKVRLPDGKSLSGTTYVTWYDANFGVVPVRKISGDYDFAAALLVRRDAVAAPSPRAIVLEDGARAIWKYTKAGAAFERSFDVKGSLYDKTASLVEMADFDDERGELTIAADASAIAESATYGALQGVTADGCAVSVLPAKMALAQKTTGVSFTFNRKTGLFTGKTTVPFEGKPKMSGSIAGVVVPGWFSACGCSEDEDELIQRSDLPFGAGYCVFTDKINKKSVKRSFSIILSNVLE